MLNRWIIRWHPLFVASQNRMLSSSNNMWELFFSTCSLNHPMLPFFVPLPLYQSRSSPTSSPPKPKVNLIVVYYYFNILKNYNIMNMKDSMKILKRIHNRQYGLHLIPNSSIETWGLEREMIKIRKERKKEKLKLSHFSLLDSSW